MRKTRIGIRHKRITGKKYLNCGTAVAALMMASCLVGSANAEVLAVRSGKHPDMTRIVVDLSEGTPYDVSYLDGPRRIVIELKDRAGEPITPALTRRAEAVGILDSVNVENLDGGFRLEISLRRTATVSRSFDLKPMEGRPHRLVFDLLPISEAEWSRQVRASLPPEPAPEADVVIAAVAETEAPVNPEPVADAVPMLNSSPFAAEMAPVDEEQYNETVYEDESDGIDFSGYVEVEGRIYPETSFYPEPEDWTLSVAAEPRLEYVSEDGNHIFIADLFGRVDAQDEDRSHFDVREFKWLGVFDDLTVTAGINTVFWGVTESNHLVDILNQDDFLEDIDQEDKLGQPMLALSYMTDIGTFSGYLMTYFRERRFPGVDGRMRMPMRVDYGRTIYESDDEEWNPDWALRWSHVMGDFDLGLYHFQGTSRDPEFVMGLDGSGNAVLIPYYRLIHQTGVDIQATKGGFLWKFESIYQTNSGDAVWGDDFWAFAGGVEYTFYGLGGGYSDLGVLMEYSYDDRGTLSPSFLEDDLFVGLRWTANDEQSSELLIGAVFDMDSTVKLVNIEGSRRIGEFWKVSLDARLFMNVPATDPIYSLSRDDFFQLRVARYF
ncbi:AMIN domain-containing protein [Emcibacter sp.]|uniref:AMIN domain-containing protein n=1 Tax=Emcibacter sp. TaxID=1979954 RepID=UPI003A8F4002